MKDPFFLAIGARLKYAMDECGIVNAADLARIIGEEGSRVRNWVNGTSAPPISEGVKLCEVFGVTLDWLYRENTSGLLESKRIRLAMARNGTLPSITQEHEEFSEAPGQKLKLAVSRGRRARVSEQEL